jgi:hypothetical protein
MLNQYQQNLPNSYNGNTQINSVDSKADFKDTYRDTLKHSGKTGFLVDATLGLYPGMYQGIYAGLKSMNRWDRANLFDPFDLAGNQNYKKATNDINKQGQKALDIGNEWQGELAGNYTPWMMAGLGSLAQGMGKSGELLNQPLPEQLNTQQNLQGYQNTLNNYLQNQNIPEYMDVNQPTGPDYAAARQSSLYGQMQDQAGRQITNNAAMSGASARGGNTNLNMANAARGNLTKAADTMYQQDVNAYNKAQANNQLRNQMLSQRYTNQMGLQNMKNQMGQNQYINNMERYEQQQNNLKNYINMMNQYAKMGNSGLSQYGGYGGKAVGSQLGTLSGLANAKASANASQQVGNSNAVGAVGSIVSSFFSDPRLKSEMQKTGAKTDKGFDIYLWKWRKKAFELAKKYGMPLSDGWDIGVNALEVEKTHPELITIIEGFKAVNYGGV